MDKFILNNGEINFDAFLSFLLLSFRAHLRYLLGFVFLFLVYFFIKTPSYSSSISFYANYNDTPTMASASIISTITGGSLASDGLGFSISNYIKSNKLSTEIVTQKYLVDNEMISLVDLWGEDYNKLFSINPVSALKKIDRHFQLQSTLTIDEKKLLFASEFLQENLRHSENRKTSLHTINVTVEDFSSLSDQIANNIFKSIINYSTEVTNIKAIEKKIFIQNRLSEIKETLNTSEENLQYFLENNQNISSPYLFLQKNRLERDVQLYNQLYISLSDQLEIAKIDEKDTTSSVFLLDKASTLPYHEGLTLFGGSIQIFLMAYLALTVLYAYRLRKTLFR